ncbi:outer membrane beta-barrel protein [Vibrio paucivorans]
MKKTLLICTLLTSAFSCSTYASDISGFYLGGGIGTSGFDGGSTADNEHDVTMKTDGPALKLIGGYAFNRIVATELQYTKYGDVKLGFSDAPDVDADIEYSSISIAANLGYTFDSGWRPFATVGLTRVGAKTGGQAGGYRIGFGGEYTSLALNHLALRLGYEADVFSEEQGGDGFENSSDNLTLSSWYVSASYKF